MGSLARLLTLSSGRCSLLRTARPTYIGQWSLVRPITMERKCVTKRPEYTETFTYDHHNLQMKRPMAPHLLIYKIHLTAIWSMAHRISGFGLAGYITLFGLINPVVPWLPHFILELNIPYFVMFVIKLFLGWPMCFHYINAIRKFIWVTGRCLNIQDFYTTGYTSYGLGTLASLYLAI